MASSVGDGVADGERFAWTKFYEAVAKKLLDCKDDRQRLANIFHRVKNDGSDQIQDVCPFTVMALFNRGTNREDQKYRNRRVIAQRLAEELQIGEKPPLSFRGIPPARGHLFQFFSVTHGGDADIAALWRVFVAADMFANSGDVNAKAEFQKSYSAATQIPLVSWNLSFGLFWAHPYFFVSLSKKSRTYISTRLASYIQAGIPPSHAPWPSSRPLNVDDYLRLRQDLSAKFEDSDFPVHSFPELAWEAWNTPSDSSTEAESEDEADDSDSETNVEESQLEPVDGVSGMGNENQGGKSEQSAKSQVSTAARAYGAQDVIADGCFQFEDSEEVEKLLDCLRLAKNLILQGPPGTGKTWLAERLAYALIGQWNPKRVRCVEFHSGMSYEDFVRGFRPDPRNDGKLTVMDGLFLDAINTAKVDHSAQPYVVVIEEVNRGNPAQIFGGLLTLLEANKRGETYGRPLTYRNASGVYDDVYIPENLYVIGTMNLADRSLASMDYALRRRFRFRTLKPMFGDHWCTWVAANCGIEPELAKNICKCFKTLNEQIADDKNLGEQCCIGHSYVTPRTRLNPGKANEWFQQVVETAIKPLLEEYWLDSPDKAREAVKMLTRELS